MKVTNHLQAMDFHTSLVSSLQHMSYRQMSDRFNAVAVHLDAGIPESITGNKALNKVGISQRINTFYSQQHIDTCFTEYCKEELGMLMRSQTVFCTEDIVNEIIEASETMIDDCIIEQDVFIPEGLLVLEKPYRFVGSYILDENYWQFEEWDITGIMFSSGNPARDDYSNKGVHVKLYGHWRGVWFVESKGKPTGFISNYRDIADAGFIYNEETGGTETHIVTTREWARMMGAEKLARLEEEIRVRSKNSDRASGELTLVDATYFEYHDSRKVGKSKKAYEPEILKLKRFILALFRMTYEYLEVEPQVSPRPFTKRATKANRKIPNDGYLVQLKLRRKTYEGEIASRTGTSPHYAFRVRGHWKRAYLRSRGLQVGDPAAYRHIYVKDYIKGRGTLVESKRVVRIAD